MFKPKYFLYARKSTEDDDHQIMSIEAQLFELREYARRENLEILEEFTEAKSAKKPGREKFGEMIAKVEQLDGVGILAWHPDRLARNSVDGGKVIYLVDTKKVVSLRFPTFWFEPTPQGLFMLQVAFGQSKYYSDNLVENINRGFRQKIRRGEWLTKAPLGYVNNPKTRNIEPHPVYSKVVQKAFEAFATGEHTYESLGNFLAEYGLVSRNRTPLVKASISRMLTNQAYLGFVKHKGELYEGSFDPILSKEIFEAVQVVLKRKTKKRKSKQPHNFPLTGLISCGECGCAITAHFATGKSGGIYRYYRCTKKKAKCLQGCLQEKYLVAQLKERLQNISIPEAWTNNMLTQVEIWEKESVHTSGIFVQNLKTKSEVVQEKLDRLVSAYVDGDIPKENYLPKKEELLKLKVFLAHQLKDFGQTAKNWIKPLRQWILDTEKATFVTSSDNLFEIKQIVQMVGLNPVLMDKSVTFSFRSPWDLVFKIRGENSSVVPQSGTQLGVQNEKSLVWWR